MPRYPFLPDYFDDAFEPFRRMQEQAEMLSNLYVRHIEPVTALQRQIASLSASPFHDLATQHLKMLDVLQGRTRSLNDQILAAAALPPSMEDQLKKIFRPPAVEASLNLLERLGLKHQEQANLAATFAAITQSAQLDSILAAARQPLIERELQRLHEMAAGSRLRLLDVLGDQLRFTGGAIPIRELEDVLARAAADAEDRPPESQLRSFLRTVIAYATRVKGHRGVVLVLIVLVWLGKTVVEGEIQTIAGEILRPVNEAIIRRLKPDVRKRVEAFARDAPALDIRQVRLVSAVNLPVRSAPRRNDSHIVARVSTPTAVLIIRRQKDWSFVQYRDGDAVIQGWVFSRYLSPLNV